MRPNHLIAVVTLLVKIQDVGFDPSISHSWILPSDRQYALRARVMARAVTPIAGARPICHGPLTTSCQCTATVPLSNRIARMVLSRPPPVSFAYVTTLTSGGMSCSPRDASKLPADRVSGTEIHPPVCL